MATRTPATEADLTELVRQYIHAREIHGGSFTLHDMTTHLRQALPTHEIGHDLVKQVAAPGLRDALDRQAATVAVRQDLPGRPREYTFQVRRLGG
jgi:hypothetical protein